MKKGITILLLLIFCCCKNEVKSSHNFNEKKLTSDLILEILSNENDDYIDLNCKCISEKSKLILPRYGSLKGFAKKNLDIKDTLHLNDQIELFTQFKISNKILSDWNIITEKEFDLYKISSSDNSIWESLLIDCPNGYYAFSKPIFNENYDKAIVGFGSICGRLCGGGVTRVYLLVDGKWKVEREISSWVS
ncbi:hypothetical protein [Pseudozobellia sp. WGM2]|uniref:hypothetical protein n=1 Tax=Pseudozobellia sp. WGM2 TaxID=2787625 RepID=UPI001AE01051|nr:hypothetical protein [Pseudozobellia sp. WGM2]